MYHVCVWCLRRTEEAVISAGTNRLTYRWMLGSLWVQEIQPWYSLQKYHILLTAEHTVQSYILPLFMIKLETKQLST